MSGRGGDLNPKQEQALKQFKENVKDVLQPNHSDHYLLRWLRARSFDLKKSEKMFRESLIWRARNKIDTILETWTPPEVLPKYYPGGIPGFDKEGNPYWIDTLGPVDLKGMFYSVRKADVIKYKIYTTEKTFKIMEEQSKKLGKTIDQVALIFDMDGIGMKHLWKPAIDCFTEMLSMLEANYPETLSVCFIVNAPRIFPICYNLAKPFLSEDTKKKIKVLGSNWKSELLQVFDADQLPKHWGGNMVDKDGDPYCKHLVCMGGDIPQSYHIQKANFVDISKFTTITVARGSAEQVEFEVKDTGGILQFNFQTDDKDIGFGLYRKTSNGSQKLTEMEEIQKTERVNSHIIPEDGRMKCDKSGTYVLNFDNTYSWLNAKKVWYDVEVLPPDNLQELHKSESYILESTNM